MIYPLSLRMTGPTGSVRATTALEATSKKCGFSVPDVRATALLGTCFAASVSFFSTVVDAAPAVSAIDGKIELGETIIIRGSGFGSGPEFFDSVNFENETSGSSAMDRENWDARNSGLITHVDSYKGNNSHTVIGGGNRHNIQFMAPDSSGIFGNRDFQEIFYSWATKDLGDFPGGTANGYSSGSSAKDTWLMLGRGGVAGSTSATDGNDIAIPTWAGGAWLISGNYTRVNWWLNSSNNDADLGTHWAFQSWNRHSFWGKVNPSNPYGNSLAAWFTTANKNGHQIINGTGRKLMTRPEDVGLSNVPPYWDRVIFGGWYAFKGSSHRIMDDIYIAIGRNAPARVEIGNNADYSKVTKITVLPSLEWKDSQIKVTLDVSGLMGVDQAYLFVTDGNGKRIDRGIPISCPECPAAPTIDSIGMLDN